MIDEELLHGTEPARRRGTTSNEARTWGDRVCAAVTGLFRSVRVAAARQRIRRANDSSFSAISPMMCSAMASDAVAAGEGAFRTKVTRR